MVTELYAGIDIGSTAVRIGLFRSNGTVHSTHFTPIVYHIDLTNQHFITQSSTQIWKSFLDCFQYLQDQLDEDETIVSIGCCATCSLVVMIETDLDLRPYPVNLKGDNDDQNVVFWMDSRSQDETRNINGILKDDKVLKYVGGSFIPEMAIPKVKHVIANTSIEKRPLLRFFDLHDFIVHQLIEKDQKINGFNAITVGNDKVNVAVDGTIKGWAFETLSKIDLEQITDPKSLPPLYQTSSKLNYSPVPVSGTALGTYKSTITVAQGAIDSYGSWYSSCGQSPNGTLVLVAGTSTCFIVSHGDSSGFIPGLWGPYQTVINEGYVSAGGISLTGKLYERLFERHPAVKDLEEDGDIFCKIEKEITKIERLSGESIHYLAKDMFYYGDLSGNRTPYCDPLMRGVTFGESLDDSVFDLVKRYICTLEFLIFQTKLIVDLLKDSVHIRKIVVCGSQGKNVRFVKLLADFIGVDVVVNRENTDLAGVKGAFYLGYSAVNKMKIDDVVRKFNNEEYATTFEPAKDSLQSRKLICLLTTKFEIMKDIAEAQKKYRKMISDAVQ